MYLTAPLLSLPANELLETGHGSPRARPVLTYMRGPLQSRSNTVTKHDTSTAEHFHLSNHVDERSQTPP